MSVNTARDEVIPLLQPVEDEEKQEKKFSIKKEGALVILLLILIIIIYIFIYKKFIYLCIYLLFINFI